MAKLRIDGEDLLMAVEGSELVEHFLDRETGEVVSLGEAGDDDEEGRERIEAGLGERYVRIDSIPSAEGFRIMEHFVESLPEGEARRALDRALGKNRPFRSFKDALYDFHEVREAWLQFHEERVTAYALRWLDEEGIDAELV